jgi:HPt (histidine-containing phosphotransfer) domain-containing protein
MDGPIDVPTFGRLQETAGADFVAELVATYLDEAPKMLAALRSALAAGDTASFRRAAHSLKSNSLTFGAMTLGALARELETSADDVVARKDAAPLDALAAEEARVADALRELTRA